jgi:uncharacterized protein (DUF2141 family)
VTVEIAGLRNAKGVVRLCMTSKATAFPACQKGSAMTGSVAASKTPVRYTFENVPSGTYAVAAFHDENGNGKMDKLMAMPKEGFAFSRNPPMRPRAPTFNEANFNVSAESLQKLKVRYIL